MLHIDFFITNVNKYSRNGVTNFFSIRKMSWRGISAAFDLQNGFFTEDLR
jgi:hypothetical protein